MLSKHLTNASEFCVIPEQAYSAVQAFGQVCIHVYIYIYYLCVYARMYVCVCVSECECD